MSDTMIADIVLLVWCVVVGIILAAHQQQVRQGRKPGQRWDKRLGKWVDW